MANFDSFCQKKIKNQPKIEFLGSASAKSVTFCSNFRVGISRIHLLNGLFSYLFETMLWLPIVSNYKDYILL